MIGFELVVLAANQPKNQNKEHRRDACLERPGISGHELNPGSFERDWIRANSKVRSRL